jgi:hypothetical protein
MADEITVWNGMTLAPLDENEPLKAGDRILIRFKWLIEGDWFRAYELSIIEKKLEGRKDWSVISYQNEQDFLIAEIEVLAEPQAPLQQAGLVPAVYVAITVVGIAAIFGFVFLMKHDQFKLIMAGKMAPKSAVGEVASGLHVLAYVAGGVVALMIIRQIMNR